LATPVIPNEMLRWLMHSATYVEPCAPNQKRPKMSWQFWYGIIVCLRISVDSWVTLTRLHKKALRPWTACSRCYLRSWQLLN